MTSPPLLARRQKSHGGAPGGTPELYFTDPDGILIQLQDATYCGGVRLSWQPLRLIDPDQTRLSLSHPACAL